MYSSGPSDKMALMVVQKGVNFDTKKSTSKPSL